MSSYENIQKYRIVERIARGGMGAVYLAQDNLGRSVAIKVLHQGILDDESRERFEREARAAGSLSHPNIVTIYEFGEHEDQPFIAMEYVSGETLAQIIKRRAPVPLVRKLQYIEDLCAGLAYAHRAGVVHRDVKPANVIVKDQIYLKILDFGIARVAQSSMTQAGLIMGTPSYMAPEQALGRPTDHRSDVFAVGLVMYELLAYQQAYPGESAHAVIHNIIHGQAEPLDVLCPDLNPALCAIVAKAIEKDPANRYQDLGTMRSEIARIRQPLELQQDEATVLLPRLAAIPLASSGAPSTPSRKTQQELLERRARQIEVHLGQAQRHLEAGELAAALEACQQAGVLDPDDGRITELLGRVRRAIDEQKVRENLAEARRQLQQENVTAAGGLIADALRLSPQSTDALALSRELEQIRREQERALERARGSRAALDRARASLNQGALESAIRLADEALLLSPDSHDAEAIRTQALGALEERRQKEEHERRAVEVSEEARRLFGEGSHHAALQRLAEFAPGHELVTRALSELRAELHAIEESLRRQEEERVRREQQERQRKEAERLQREQWARSQLLAGQKAIDDALFDDAVALLQRLRDVDPSTPGVSRVLEVATRGQTEARAARERRRAADEHAVVAAECLARGDVAAAGPHIDAALDLVPDHERATTLRQQLLQGPPIGTRPSETSDSGPAVDRSRAPTRLVAAAGAILVVAVAVGLWMTVRSRETPATNGGVAPASQDAALRSSRDAVAPPSEGRGDTAQSPLESSANRPPQEVATPAQPDSIEKVPQARGTNVEPEAAAAKTATGNRPGSPAPTVTTGEIAAVENRVRGSIAAGNLIDAFREADIAAKRNGGDVRAQGLVAQVVAAAASAADTAKARATAEQAAMEPSFVQADGRVQAAQRARAEGRSDQAVRDYVAAEKLFLEAIPAVAAVRTIDARVARGIQFLKEGKVSEAAAEASASLALRSAHEGARGLQARVLAAAKDRAAAAHEKVGKSSASSLPAYQEAVARERQASNVKSPAEWESAVRDYLEAERQFLAMASTVPVTPSATPSGPTLPTGGRAATASDAREVNQVLQRYAAAYGKMAVGDLRAVFPKVSKRRTDALSKNRGACRVYQVVFGEPKIELVADGRILVDVSTTYECTPRAGGGVLPSTVTEQMTLGAQPGGGLIILSVAEP